MLGTMQALLLFTQGWWKIGGMVMLCNISIPGKTYLRLLWGWHAFCTYCQAAPSDPQLCSVQRSFRSSSFLLLVACVSSVLKHGKTSSARWPKLGPGRQWHFLRSWVVFKGHFVSDKPAQVLTGLHGHGQKPFGTQPSQRWLHTHSKGDPACRSKSCLSHIPICSLGAPMWACVSCVCLAEPSAQGLLAPWERGCCALVRCVGRPSMSVPGEVP